MQFKVVVSVCSVVIAAEWVGACAATDNGSLGSGGTAGTGASSGASAGSGGVINGTGGAAGNGATTGAGTGGTSAGGPGGRSGSGGRGPRDGGTGGQASGGANSSGGSAAGGSGGSAAGGSGGSATGGSGGGGSQTLFPPSAPWYRDVSGDPKAANSDAIINWLTNAGGWGTGRMEIDFSLEVIHADASTPFVSWTPTSDWYSPDCDTDPIPVPPGGALEGETGYQCTTNGDCHLLVIDDANHRLYEMWRANEVGGAWQGGCLAVWNLTEAYPPSERGDQCTSADAGGFPMTALLFNADEVAAGSINHAIRFILPNSRIRNGVYLHPATHSTGSTSGGSNAPPYGIRLRLRADYPLSSLPNDGARTVARAMQKYGMFLSDGGNIALTAQDDRFTQAKWAGLLGARDLAALQTSDFEVVDEPTPIPYTGDCVRNP